MTFAIVVEVTEGTILVADGGFTCIKEGSELTVARDEHGKLYVPCSSGKHYLNGQCDDDSVEGAEYVGLYLKS